MIKRDVFGGHFGKNMSNFEPIFYSNFFRVGEAHYFHFVGVFIIIADQKKEHSEERFFVPKKVFFWGGGYYDCIVKVERRLRTRLPINSVSYVRISVLRDS